MPEGIITTFRKSILAGICIGIGATAFLACENKALGALLFSIGLFLICTYGFALFTGKVGYCIRMAKEISPIYYFVVWFGNLLGCFLVAIPLRLTNTAFAEKASLIVESKLSQTVPQTIVYSIFCGILVFFAVDIYKKNISSLDRIAGLIFGVVVFILSGFEHSIADMCYMIYGVSDDFSNLPDAIIYILIVSISNAVGSIIVCSLIGDEKKKK